jgi:ubiquinone biosynthesis protein
MDREGRFRARLLHETEWRDRRDPLGLEALGVVFPFGHLLRLTRAGFVLSRAGLFRGIDVMALPISARVPFGIAKLIGDRGRGPGLDLLPAAISQLGPSYVKLGQFLATRPDVVGPDVALRLELLQDHMAPFPREQSVKAVEAAFNRPIDTIFISFGDSVAAASIAQVHHARVRDAKGVRDVAVKVLRPGVERLFRRDLSDMYFAARVAERWFPETKRLKPVEVVDTLARTVTIEMDFRLEAAAASEFAENTAGESDFRVPAVDWDRTEKEVLTLEWIGAIPLSDPGALVAAGLDLPALARTIIQSFLRHAMRDGFFHADMHQGNLFVDAQGRLIAVDFGIMGRLGIKERRFLAEVIYGFITRDYRRVAEVHLEAGYVPHKYKVEDFAQAIRAIGEPIHARTADQISMAKVLTLLFEITALFDMKTRTELVLLQKTMVVVEGVGRNLDPKLDMWSTAEPVVRGWIEKNLGPVGKIEDVGRALSSLAQFAANLPAVLLRTENIVTQIENMAEDGFALSEAAMEQIGVAEARGARLGHFALWLIVVIMIFFLLR